LIIFTKSYIIHHRPAIAPRTELGVTECSYVNAFGFHVMRDIAFKISTQALFSLDGFLMFIVCDILGLLSQYAEMVGYCKTRAELIAQSKKARYIATPLTGFPFQKNSTTAFPVCGINFFPIVSVLQTRPINECFINYSDVSEVPSAVPRNLLTKEILNKDDFSFVLSSTNVWVTKVERESMVTNYNDVIYPEFRIAGRIDVPKGPAQKIRFPVDCKGALAFTILIAREKGNLDRGHWTCFSSSSGEDLIDQFNIITGSAAHEDSLPAVVSRVGKFVEIFGKRTIGCMYVQNYCNQGNEISGHLNFTNVEKQNCDVYLREHAELELMLIECSYNAWWTELGQGGKVWA